MMKATFFLLLVAVVLMYAQAVRVSCGCRYPRIFMPVCGEDNVTYDNEGVLRCVNRCNESNIRMLHKGACLQ